MSSGDDYLIYAAISKGYAIKVIVDVLSTSLNRLTIGFFKDCIRLCQADEIENGQQSLFNMKFERSKLREYEYKEDVIISVNSRHLKQQLKSVKKKDMLVLYMLKKKPDMFFGTITPENGGPVARKETISVVANREKALSEPLIDPPSEDAYHWPFVIDSSGFQKIKKQTSYNTPIRIQMHANAKGSEKYLSFSCDGGQVFSSELAFGALPKEELEYTANFDSSRINSLVKLPGINKQMQFFCPRKDFKQHAVPLRIRVDAENLGWFEVYILHLSEEDESTDITDVVAPVTKKAVARPPPKVEEESEEDAPKPKIVKKVASKHVVATVKTVSSSKSKKR